MIAQSIREEFDYVLNEDKELPKDQQTVFRLRPVSLRLSNEIDDIIGIHSKADGYPAGTINYKLLKAGLRGWTNMSGDNATLEFTEHEIPDRHLLKLSSIQRTEIAVAIWVTKDVTDKESKN